MQQQDYIERMIAQVAEATGRALGLAAQGRHLEAQGELDATWARAVGLRRADLLRLDGATVRGLLGAKATVAALLLEAEAGLQDSQGDLVGARRLRTVAATWKR